MILSHNISGISYKESTPVISDITTDHKIVHYGLALSSKHSIPKTQLLSITFRIGSKTEQLNTLQKLDERIQEVGEEEPRIVMVLLFSTVTFYLLCKIFDKLHD